MARRGHKRDAGISRRQFLRLGAGAATAALHSSSAPFLAHSGPGNESLTGDSARVITQVQTSARKICLTFDDLWNEFYTLKICREFYRRQIRLTLFPVGLAIQNNLNRPNEGYTNLYPRLRDMGHEFGCHLFTHRPISDFSLQQLIDEEMEPALRVMRRALGQNFRPVGIRPPYGIVTDSVKELAARYGLPLILWGLDSQDAICTSRQCPKTCESQDLSIQEVYRRLLLQTSQDGLCDRQTCAESCVESIMNNYESYLRPGSIILHHAIKASYLATPRIVELLINWNMQAIPLSKLLTYRSA